MEIKNLKKVAKRIKKAIKNKEKIVLYGDADLDGVTSVIILEETIKNLGGEIAAVYFPDREVEGYGISQDGLNFLTKQLFRKGDKSPALLIALDCGIGNFKEVIKAKKMGFEVIIIDHHEVLDGLPQASIVVDPKQKEDKYPFKGLATAGISYKLSQNLLSNFLTESLKKNFLELVALATLADMMPKESENKEFISQGLFSLQDSWRPGIRAFFETDAFQSYPNLGQKVSKIISILNIRDVENQLPASFRLLTAPSIEESQKLIKKLLAESEIRRKRIKEMAEEIEARISEKSESIIFEGDSAFEFVLIGVVASILSQKYQKPVFLYKKLEKESQGAVRVPSGINSVALMKKCSKYLLTYGGHPQASGFRIKNENLEKFKDCLIKKITKYSKPDVELG